VFYTHLLACEDGTKTQTPGNYPKETIQLSNVSAKTHPLSCKVFFPFGDCSPLAYDVALIGNLLLTCQKSLMPPPSGQLNKSKMLGEEKWLHYTVQREFVKMTDSSTEPTGRTVEAR
jgi:hypothetical protein